jgi:hypothetical protein
MCSSPKPPPPPPPPAPLAPQQVATVTPSEGNNRKDAAFLSSRGRNSLRIDKTVSGDSSGSGLNIPT